MNHPNRVFLLWIILLSALRLSPTALAGLAPATLAGLTVQVTVTATTGTYFSHNVGRVSLMEFQSGGLGVRDQNIKFTWTGYTSSNNRADFVFDESLGPIAVALTFQTEFSGTFVYDAKARGSQIGTFAFGPQVTAQPGSIVATAGQPASFSVTATGGQPLTYQWIFNGVPVPGATSATFTIPKCQNTDQGTYWVYVSGPGGTVASSTATLTVRTLFSPVITSQPLPVTVSIGQSASFSVTATGTAPLTYQWVFNGIPLPNANGPTYTISNCQPVNAGSYRVLVSGPGGFATSTEVALTLKAIDIAPSITIQPVPMTVTVGQAATFTVSASGTQPLTYQWFFNGTPLSGATSPTYTIASCQAANSGSYSVVVTGPGGTATSSTAFLWLTPKPGQQPGFVTNGLVAFFPFNGNANDQSGRGYPGTIQGSNYAFVADRFNNNAGALALNQGVIQKSNYNGDYVSIERPADLDFNGDFSLSLWAYFTPVTNGTQATENLISSGFDSNSFNLVTDLNAGGLSGGPLSGNDVLSGVFSHKSSAGWIVVQAQVSPRKSVWSHISLVRRAGLATIFLDGVPLATKDVGSVTLENTIWFGKHKDESGLGAYWYPFVGSLDDIRLYNRALSNAEVAGLYQYESSSSDGGFPAPASTAAATARVINGILVGLDVSSFGSGYTNTPRVRLIGGGGTGATAAAVLTNGTIGSLRILNAGSGYTNLPKVVIDPPFIPTPGISAKALVFGPNAAPVIHLAVDGLAPYDPYQVEFMPELGAPWTALGNAFVPTAQTNSQFATGLTPTGFYRVRRVE